ncbi:hypothetical protein AXF14_11120 [Actinomyces radicidentis]|uniref:Uncharacterized protein n=1 Tax=Actinomyces radicidentis TaxID=111015 RepID=A0A109W879_ACTRD|nr:hypothetical protein AXF14_11120 [Actinomyces radicidentis]
MLPVVMTGVPNFSLKAHGDRGVRADVLADLGDDLLGQAGGVLRGAAVLVLALVVVGREELVEQVGVARVDLDRVEAGLLDAAGGGAELADDVVELLDRGRAGRVAPTLDGMREAEIGWAPMRSSMAEAPAWLIWIETIGP